jgi:glycosyltransferase involved in cell wall biosynthesis
MPRWVRPDTTVNDFEAPLISCIMPTYDRRRFVPRAIAQFQHQDYPHKELIIVDDGADAIADLIPEDPDIRLIRLPRRMSVGAKRNLACQHARGEFIAHWDDDDWHAPHRLSCQARGLFDSDAVVCGLKEVLFLDIRVPKAWKFSYPAGQRPWLSGNSLMYRKDFWLAHPFCDISVGEDSRFVWTAEAHRLLAVADSNIHVGFIHGANVSPKHVDGPWWKPHPLEDIRRLLGDEWHSIIECELSANISVPRAVPRTARVPPLRNLFACLVHESPDCILDLVRNLRHLDPTSVVLVYNGSANPQLLDRIPLARYGAVAHPSPQPMAWGKLHGFAIDCMRFGRREFDFDTLTVVDSDQLALRPGYSAHLAGWLQTRPRAGMLGNAPARQLPSSRVAPVVTAFEEMDLWRPLLRRFKDGEDKFVHWSFWPSTVFTAAAADDLVRFFDHDRELADIMSRSRIWATEEVILPTLTALLGHEIAANPCSYDVVKYRVPYSAAQIRQSFDRADLYWAHPIPRRFNDVLRREIRGRYGGYREGPALGALGPPQALPPWTRPLPTSDIDPPLLRTRPIFERMRSIAGWLEDEEADLLLAAAVRAVSAPVQGRIVEIGSFCGKATVVLASVVRALSPSKKVYAVDSHDGRVGTADKIAQMPPSLDTLRANLQAAGLEAQVEIIQSRPHEVDWGDPIAFLFVDGLHDYVSVAGDFRHFEPWLMPEGCVAFHDYADYFPGVMRIVSELVERGAYACVARAGSLVLLRRTA